MNILQNMSLLIVSLLVSTTVLANSITDADYQEFSSERIDAANVALEIANEALTVQAARMTQINDEILGQGCSNFGRNNYKCKRNTTKTSLLIGTFKQWKHEGMAIGQMADDAIQEKGRAVYFAKYGVEAPVPKVAVEAVEEDQIDPRLKIDPSLHTRFQSAINELAYYNLALQGVKENSYAARTIKAKIQHYENLRSQVKYEQDMASLERAVIQGAINNGITEEVMQKTLDYAFVKLDDDKHRRDYRNMLRSIKLSGSFLELDVNRPNGISKPPSLGMGDTGDDLASYKLANQVRARENAKRVRNGQESLNFFVDDIPDVFSEWSMWIYEYSSEPERVEEYFYDEWIVVTAPSDQEFTTRSRQRHLTTTFSGTIYESRTRYLIIKYLRDEVPPEGARQERRERPEVGVSTHPVQGQTDLLFPNPDYVAPVEVPVVETPVVETPVETPEEITDSSNLSWSDSLARAHALDIKGAGSKVVIVEHSAGAATDERLTELESIATEGDVSRAVLVGWQDNVWTIAGDADIIALAGTSYNAPYELKTSGIIEALVIANNDNEISSDILYENSDIENLIFANAINGGQKEVFSSNGVTKDISGIKDSFLVVEATNNGLAVVRIAGTAALVKSHVKKADGGSLTASEIRNIILTTATDIGAAGIDDVYGNGELNLLKALSVTQ